MAERPPFDLGGAGSTLLVVNRGQLLGLLPREPAERGYRLYQERRVIKIVWTGEHIEAVLSQPPCTVQVVDGAADDDLISHCSHCGGESACAHAAAALLQWFDIRPTMQRLGPGAAWRAKSRHPFITPGRAAAERVDLSHLTGADLRSALELQLSLQTTGTATAKLAGNMVEIHITLPSGDTRVVFFSAPLLPSALPLLRSLPRLQLEGDLLGLELSEARLNPVLCATWEDEGIVLEPGYRLADGSVLPGATLDGRIHGRWARIGNLLCRVLDPATPLVPYHRKGRQVLAGEEALRYLNLDHPQLSQHSWYLPQGHLATFHKPTLPKPIELEATRTPNGKILIRPTFQAAGANLDWPAAVRLMASGFARMGDVIVRTPELTLFREAGFRLPKRRLERGLLGDQIAFIRLVAETGLPVTGGDDELRRLAEILEGREPPEIGDPPGLSSTLRPYQRTGVAWLWSRYLAGIGALLADDMGLGKTHQVMGLLCLARQRNPDCNILVVCPRGVLEHWNNLLTTFAPGLEVVIFHGPGRSFDQIPGRGALVLTTYDLLLRSAEEIGAYRWDIAVYDEAQRIKNPRTKAARAARRLPAGFRVALTGTPLENRLLELWSVVDLILPGFLGSERDFRSIYRSPTHHQLHRLRRRLAALTLRRVKEQVLADLPDKVEDLRYCRMLPAQLGLYRSIYSSRVAQISEALRDDGAEIPYMHIFAMLTKLKQVCDHPALVDGAEPHLDSGKLEVFDQILDEALAGDHQVVVFSQYVQMIDILSRQLEGRDIEHLVLTGATRDRSRVIRRFNSEQHERVLLASLLAGGVGIDLTGASVVIHYDRWWNPARENQATDRVHRIGQRRFVQVFKLITRDTIEERIDQLIRDKTELINEVVVPSEEVVGRLSRRELAELLDIDLVS